MSVVVLGRVRIERMTAYMERWEEEKIEREEREREEGRRSRLNQYKHKYKEVKIPMHQPIGYVHT